MQKWVQVAVVQAMFRSEEVKLLPEIARWKMSAAEEMVDKEIQETSLAPLMVTQKSTALSFSTQYSRSPETAKLVTSPTF